MITIDKRKKVINAAEEFSKNLFQNAIGVKVRWKWGHETTTIKNNNSEFECGNKTITIKAEKVRINT